MKHFLAQSCKQQRSSLVQSQIQQYRALQHAWQRQLYSVGKLVHRSGHENWFAVQGNHTLVTGGYDGLLVVWNTDSGAIHAHMSPPGLSQLPLQERSIEQVSCLDFRLICSCAAPLQSEAYKIMSSMAAMYCHCYTPAELCYCCTT